MRSVLLNCGFGSPLSQEDSSWIRDHGFHGVRSDYGTGVLASLFATKFKPLILAVGGKNKNPTREFIVDRFAKVCRELRDLGYLHRPYPIPAIEPYNEPDIDDYWKSRPEIMGGIVWQCYQMAPRGVTVVTPGISNLTKEGLAYLERMVNNGGLGIPDNVAVGFHRYPPSDDPTEAHEGFHDRWAEVARLRFLAGKRKLWCTETGWTAGPRKKPRPFPLCFLEKNTWLTEQKVAEYVTTELRFWARVPDLEALVLYQINDGPNRNNPEDNFGLRRYPDRSDKILAERMPALIKEVTHDET